MNPPCLGEVNLPFDCLASLMPEGPSFPLGVRLAWGHGCRTSYPPAGQKWPLRVGCWKTYDLVPGWRNIIDSFTFTPLKSLFKNSPSSGRLFWDAKLYTSVFSGCLGRVFIYAACCGWRPGCWESLGAEHAGCLRRRPREKQRAVPQDTWGRRVSEPGWLFCICLLNSS